MANNTVTVSSGLGLAMLLIMFWGEPDLCDALIQFLIAASKTIGG